MGRRYQNCFFTFFCFDSIMDNERILQRKCTTLSTCCIMIIDIKFNFMILKIEAYKDQTGWYPCPCLSSIFLRRYNWPTATTTIASSLAIAKFLTLFSWLVIISEWIIWRCSSKSSFLVISFNPSPTSISFVWS